jgi:ABC-2 type transport system ATP-binding protein
LLLDEPSTGLDPGARREFMRYLLHLRDTEGITIVLTTHDMEEADRCDRIALLDAGRLGALDGPAALKARVGGDVVGVHGPDVAGLAERIRDRFGCEPAVVDGTLRLKHARGHELLRDLVEAFGAEFSLVTYGHPTLEDVFIGLTGHRLWAASDGATAVGEG